MPPDPLTNFEIQKYCLNEPKFNGVYSRNNFPSKNHLQINKNSLDSSIM